MIKQRIMLAEVHSFHEVTQLGWYSRWKFACLSGRTKKLISRKLKYIFTKKTIPQLLGHIGLQNMKAGVKSNFGRWMLTSSLRTREQIDMTCQSVYYHLHNIRQIRKFLTPASTKLLVQGVIMASIDYFNGLLYGVPAVRLSKLQRLQYSAARLITHTPRYCHITLLLLALHWLLLKFRICHKIAVISFETIHNIGPAF